MSENTYPLGIIENDLKLPSYRCKKDRIAHDVGDHGTLTLYEVRTFGWVIVTLRIGGASRSNQYDRYYGIRVIDAAPVRVGRGPHVLRKIEIYIRKSRVKALASLIDLYKRGLEQAHTTRDRIGTRRFQGQLERAAGRRSWLWNA